jgi:tetratricopeptide (TPR) repeat protein
MWMAHHVDVEYVRLIDFAPTILEAAKVTKPAPLRGCSLLGTHCSADSYFESLSTNLNRGWAPLTGVIHDRRKFIDLPLAELYDLPSDPREANNLRAERRRDAEEARRILAAMHGEEKVQRNVSSEEAAQLRGLGYLSGGAAQKSAYGPGDDPKNLVTLDNKMHQVIDSYERHDVSKALKLAKEVVAERPDMSAGRELLAFMLQQSERVPEAIDNLRAAIKTGGTSDSLRVQLGLLLTEQGKTAEAVQVLEPLSKGSDPDALNAYGIALADQGNLNGAADQFARVLKMDPNNAPALQNLGIVALRRNDVTGAQSYLSRALELNPRLPLALNTLGVVYARQNDFGRAVEAWGRAVDIDPRQYDALFNLGFVEGRAGHAAEAKRALTRFVETAPKERYAADIVSARRALAMLP